MMSSVVARVSAARDLADVASLRRSGSVRPGHHLADHHLSFRSDPVHDVVDADRAGDVMDKEQQPADADQRQQHRPQHRGDWRERVWERVRRGKRSHAVRKRTEKDPQRPLRGARFRNHL